MPIVLESQATGKGSGDPDVSLPGTNESIPRGIEAQFYYNGLIFNDTTVIDKYRVLSIDGLGDADVRDAREENPAEDGETPYDNFAGGRTLVFNIRIESYTLAKLRDMEEALRTAFQTSAEELPLVFLTGDPEMDHYINCRKLQPIQKGEEQKALNTFYRDVQVTLRASNPRFLKTATKEYTLYPNKITNGGFEGGSNGVAPSGGWVQDGPSFVVSTLLVSNAWANSGSLSVRSSAVKDASTTLRTLTISTALGDAGMPVTASGVYYARSKINVTNPAHLGIKASIAWYNGAAFLSSTDGNITTASGIQTIQASGRAPATSTRAAFQAIATSSAVSDIMVHYLDDVWFVETDGINTTVADPGTVIVTNFGNYKSQPTIFLHGQLSLIDLENQTSGDHFILASAISIADGDFYEADIEQNTLTSESGVNKFSDLKSTSDWPQINPGTNLFSVDVDNSISGSTAGKIVIQFQDSWL